jgi:hypothetical protein
VIQYEYKKVYYHELKTPYYDQLDIEKLNSLGAEGWELVIVSSGECIFKKQVKKRVVRPL